MAADRTELTWSYQPENFFEAPYEADAEGCRLRIDAGKAVAVAVGDRPLEDVEQRLAALVRSVFEVRALQLRRGFTLDPSASVVEFTGANRNIFVRDSVSICVTAGQVDIVVADTRTGAVLRDSKAERIATQTSEIEALSRKALHDALLRGMLTSYSTAIDDPDNELTHLYEIRDALHKRFGSDAAARKALDISAAEWSDFGRIANDAPLREGRHRGKHSDALRRATADELERVRELAADWMRKYAASVDVPVSGSK